MNSFENPQKFIEFLEKTPKPEEKQRIYAVLDQIKAFSGGKIIELPALMRAPDDEDGDWHMYWGNEKETISIDFESATEIEPEDLYLFYRNRAADTYWGTNSPQITEDFAKLIISFRYPKGH